MFLSDIGSTLSVLKVPEDVIADVMSMLEKNAAELEDNIPVPIDGDAFGPSSWGSQLGFDAGLAQQTVIEEVPKMVAGLRGYTTNLKLFVEDGTETDATQAQAIDKITAATQCVAEPTFSTPAQCTVPTGEDS